MYQNGQDHEGTGSLCINKGHHSHEALMTYKRSQSQKASVQSPQ